MSRHGHSQKRPYIQPLLAMTIRKLGIKELNTPASIHNSGILSSHLVSCFNPRPLRGKALRRAC